MNRITKVVLLSLIVIVQALTLIGGHIAYQQMSQTLNRWQSNYWELLEETHPNLGSVLPGLDPPSPFAPLFPLILFGLFITAALFVDEVRHC